MPKAMQPLDRLTLFATLLRALRRRSAYIIGLCYTLYIRPPEGTLIGVTSLGALVIGYAQIHKNPGGPLLDFLRLGILASLALLAVLVMRSRRYINVYTLRISVLFVGSAAFSLQFVPIIRSPAAALGTVVIVASMITVLLLTIAYWGKIVGEHSLAA